MYERTCLRCMYGARCGMESFTCSCRLFAARERKKQEEERRRKEAAKREKQELRQRRKKEREREQAQRMAEDHPDSQEEDTGDLCVY